tara:strand:- start:73204 stop:73440 length:237 start_codon:yes stop_codon:yes gene_type:complete
MTYIGTILNEIRFDKTAKPEEYTITYFDRIAEKTEEVKFISIGRKGNFITVLKDGKEYSVPLHRIRKIKKKGKVIWEQ